MFFLPDVEQIVLSNSTCLECVVLSQVGKTGTTAVIITPPRGLAGLYVKVGQKALSPI